MRIKVAGTQHAGAQLSEVVPEGHPTVSADGVRRLGRVEADESSDEAHEVRWV